MIELISRCCPRVAHREPVAVLALVLDPDEEAEDDLNLRPPPPPRARARSRAGAEDSSLIREERAHSPRHARAGENPLAKRFEL